MASDYDEGDRTGSDVHMATFYSRCCSLLAPRMFSGSGASDTLDRLAQRSICPGCAGNFLLVFRCALAATSRRSRNWLFRCMDGVGIRAANGVSDTLQVVCRGSFAKLLLPQFLIDDLQHLLATEIVPIVECPDHVVQDSAHALSRQGLNRLGLPRVEDCRLRHHAGAWEVCGDAWFRSGQRRGRTAE